MTDFKFGQWVSHPAMGPCLFIEHQGERGIVISEKHGNGAIDTCDLTLLPPPLPLEVQTLVERAQALKGEYRLSTWSREQFMLEKAEICDDLASLSISKVAENKPICDGPKTGCKCHEDVKGMALAGGWDQFRSAVPQMAADFKKSGKNCQVEREQVASTPTVPGPKGSMTREEALAMITAYGRYAKSFEDVLCSISTRFPEGGSEAKAMRWLGFCQGVLLERGVFDLEDLKNQSMMRTVPDVPDSEVKADPAKEQAEVIEELGRFRLDVLEWLKHPKVDCDTVNLFRRFADIDLSSLALPARVEVPEGYEIVPCGSIYLRQPDWLWRRGKKWRLVEDEQFEQRWLDGYILGGGLFARPLPQPTPKEPEYRMLDKEEDSEPEDEYEVQGQWIKRGRGGYLHVKQRPGVTIGVYVQQAIALGVPRRRLVGGKS